MIRIVFLLTSYFVCLQQVLACQCESLSEVEVKKHSDYVFNGYVDAQTPSQNQAYGVATTFNIISAEKGLTITDKKITIYHDTELSACGIRFDSTHEYRIFAYIDQKYGALATTNKCLGNIDLGGRK